MNRYILMLCLLWGGVLWAQQDQLQLQKDIAFIKADDIFCNNSALMSLSDSKEFSESYLTYINSYSQFKAVQNAKQQNGISFYSEGYKAYSNLKCKGSVLYKNYNEKGIQWSNILFPQGNTPYIIADSLDGEWEKRSYKLNGDVVTSKLFNMFYVGVGMNYHVETGAKQKDPRPLNTYKNLKNSISILFPLSSIHNIGGTVSYTSIKEEIDVDYSNNLNKKYSVYWLRALGEAPKDYRNFNVDFKQDSKVLGLSMFYAYKTDLTKFYLTVLYNDKEEVSGINHYVTKKEIRKDACYESNKLQLESILNRYVSKGFHQVKLGVRSNVGKGYKPVMKSSKDITPEELNSYKNHDFFFDEKLIQAEYNFYRTNSEKLFHWRLGVFNEYGKEKQQHQLLQNNRSISFVRSKLTFEITHKINIKTSIKVGAEGAHKQVIDHHQYINPNNKSDVVKGFIIPEYQYLSQSYSRAKLQLRLSRLVKNYIVFSQIETKRLFVPEGKVKQGLSNHYIAVKIGLVL
ncbi:hypothetical protein EMN47_01630 [Prolixibacteraceae bacterium JC049]|nr:hypothetical protein [Prolixibacteraceae bacterium JC049]